MASHVLTAFTTTPIWIFGVSAYVPLFATVSGGTPFTADTFDPVTFLAQGTGFIFTNDSVINPAATISSIVLRTTHVESVAGKYFPQCGYQENNTGFNDRSRAYDGHLGGSAPTTSATWLMTENTVQWSGLPFTVTDLFTLVFYATSGGGTNPVNPANGVYTVLDINLLVNYTEPTPTIVPISGSGGIQAGGTAALGSGISGSGGVELSGDQHIIAAGAGVPPELHGNQWGLLQFVMQSRLEEKL